MAGILLIVTLTPTDAFLALSSDQRHSLLAKVAAPIQEWTGQDGGVIFSERVSTADGKWCVVLAVVAQTEGIVTAFAAALNGEDASTHFGVNVVHGPFLAVSDANDSAEGQRVTERIFKPFLE